MHWDGIESAIFFNNDFVDLIIKFRYIKYNTVLKLVQGSIYCGSSYASPLNWMHCHWSRWTPTRVQQGGKNKFKNSFFYWIAIKFQILTKYELQICNIFYYNKGWMGIKHVTPYSHFVWQKSMQFVNSAPSPQYDDRSIRELLIT